ncbi:MAG: O-antigen ligase family protein, partial [Acidobacteria bacterium]
MRKWEKLRPGVFFTAALVLAWGLSLAGAARPSTYYLLFLCYAGLTALVFLTAPESKLANWRWFPVYAVGAFLILNVIFRSPLLARGYIVLSLGWMAFVLTALLIEQDWRRARFLAVFLASIGIVEALHGLAQSVANFDSPGHMATGTFLNHNHYAGLLNLTLPFGFGAALYYLSRRRRHRNDPWELYSKAWAALLAAVIVGLPVVLSVSRAGIVVFVICLTASFLLLGHKRRELRRSAPGGAAMLAVTLVLVVALSSGLALDHVLARFSELGPDSGFRLVVYRDTATILRSNLWTGIGPGMFGWRFRPVQTAGEHVIVDHAHNDYLETATEWGLPVAVAFWALVVWLWYRSVRLFLTTRKPWTEAMALGCVFA